MVSVGVKVWGLGEVDDVRRASEESEGKGEGGEGFHVGWLIGSSKAEMVLGRCSDCFVIELESGWWLEGYLSLVGC